MLQCPKKQGAAPDVVTLNANCHFFSLAMCRLCRSAGLYPFVPKAPLSDIRAGLR
jgi:hypothetical protein